MSKDLISVIVPVYKVEPYLRSCIESVLNQTYENIELILVDDGSPDSCGEICDEYAAKDNRVVVIHQKNQGQSAARNHGLDISKGTLIGFLDSDDTIEKEFYQVLYSTMQTYHADITCAGIKNIYVNKEEAQSTDLVLEQTGREAMKNLLDEHYMRFEVWNKLYTKEVIGDVRFKSGQIHEEVHFLTEVLIKAKKVVYVDRALHNYLVERDGNTNTNFRENRMAVFEEFGYLEKRLEDNGMGDLKINLYRLILDYTLTFYRLAVEADDAPEGIEDRIYNVFLEYYDKMNAPENKEMDKAKYKLFKKSPQLYVASVGFRNKLTGK